MKKLSNKLLYWTGIPVALHPREGALTLGRDQSSGAQHRGVSASINEIVMGKRRVSAETVLRLARYFGMSPQFWFGLQSDFDLDVAADEMGERLMEEVKIRAKAG